MQNVKNLFVHINRVNKLGMTVTKINETYCITCALGDLDSNKCI